MNQRHSKHAVEPSGLERKILRKLPQASIASILIPAIFYAYIRYFPPITPDGSVEKTVLTAAIVATAVGLTLLTAIFTLAIGCWIVVIMKGPARYADSYPLQDAEKPHDESKDTRSF